jgi:chemotaxis protein CheX
MTTPRVTRDDCMPEAYVEAVQAALDALQATFFTERPVPTTRHRRDADDGPCIAGIISFVGDFSCSLSWVMSQSVAPALVQKFAGFEIPFESPDMGDAAGELANVFAGEIVLQLEQRGLKVQLSLPTVVRGSPLELLPESGPSIVNLQYGLPEGTFWFRLAATTNSAARWPANSRARPADELVVVEV